MEAVMGLRDIQGIVNFELLDVWTKLQIEFPQVVWKCLATARSFGLAEDNYRSPNFDENNLIKRWFTVREHPKGNAKKSFVPKVKDKNQNNDESDNDDDEDYDVDELLEDRILDDIYAEVESRAPVGFGKQLSYSGGLSLKDSDKNIKDLNKRINKLREEKNPVARQEALSILEQQLLVVKNRKQFLEQLFTYYKNDMLDLPDVTELLDRLKRLPGAVLEFELERGIPTSTRWALYFAIVERARALSAQSASEIETRLIKEQKKLQQMQRYGDGWILENSKVVGMTTTGAAKYNDLVKMMKSKIVIVEEAAEVLEAHIVTCITQHCEHLILIGDHRQLRPSTTVYDLAKKFNLDISLFERMINNNLNCYQLKVQHRMRPEIANLVVGTIYEELNNYPNVYLYPPVKGVNTNLYFLAHNELEKSESDSMSKSNIFEAKFMAAFCRYLVLQGYEPKQITVLTTYTGQMFLLKKCVGEIANCRGIRVTCVDNFQGEENDAILLSLVRSNMESKIGFLNIENRICVALSRARHGLFIIGNMTMLASKSTTWAQIQEKLETRRECGRNLTIRCQIHDTVSNVNCANDFTQHAPEGGCNLLCDTVLICTHRCVKVCHIKDQKHEEYKCMQACLKNCMNNHPCQYPCSRRCPACNVPFLKILRCQHEKIMPCHQNPEEISCDVIVRKKLLCGHEEDMACHIDPANYVCRIPVDKTLPCDHRRTLECHVDPASITCKIVVEKDLPCGHKQMEECRFHPEVIKCTTPVTKSLENCGHTMEVRCSDKGKPMNCKNQCSIRLNCGHACTRVCHVLEDPKHLNYICKKDCAKSCPEGHKCSGKHKCHTTCPPCNVTISRKLPCSHEKELYCSADVTVYECLEACNAVLDCYHECQNLCFQPCGPCKIVVQKRIQECGHPISVECSIQPTQSLCLTLVKPSNRSMCSHDTLVPCNIRDTASPEKSMEFCTIPCLTPFLEQDGGCGHLCLGSCGSCRQGRFHEKCREECGKTLVCGHICKFPCSKACPPCDEKCLMKCEHSECQQKCGTPCLDCSEPCPWQCPHKRCNKLCREICDRDNCDEPCPEKLPCGHPCIGFCGEVCPPQCRLCDKKELTEFILYGYEEDDDSRFVFLPDCKHSIESEGLKYHMNLDLDDGEIGIKRCPRCRTVIRYCRRFSSIIRKRLKDVIMVKERIFGNQKIVMKTQNDVIQKLGAWDSDGDRNRYFQAFTAYLLEHVVEIVPVRRGAAEIRKIPKQVDEWTMSTISNLISCAEGAVAALRKGKPDLKADLWTDLLQKYRTLFANVMGRQMPLSAVEIRDIGLELERLHDLNQVYLRRSNSRFTDGHTRALPIYYDLLRIVLSHKPYIKNTKQQLHGYLQALEDVLKTGLGITDMERLEILKAFDMRQGRWFKCPNGHIYVITECGGAMQEGTCNECGARIGGGSHRLRHDNTLAGEMDGAMTTLYPNMLQ